MNPKARHQNLLVQDVDNEVVVYDTARKRAHHLNPSAASVWRLLDGSRSINAIAAELGVAESVVGLAIDDLANAGLLDTGRAEVHVGPAGEAVLLVPLALAVAEQYDLVHNGPSRTVRRPGGTLRTHDHASCLIAAFPA